MIDIDATTFTYGAIGIVCIMALIGFFVAIKVIKDINKGNDKLK